MCFYIIIVTILGNLTSLNILLDYLTAVNQMMLSTRITKAYIGESDAQKIGSGKCILIFKCSSKHNVI